MAAASPYSASPAHTLASCLQMLDQLQQQLHGATTASLQDDNTTAEDDVTNDCSSKIPTTVETFYMQPTWALVGALVGIAFCIATIALFIEQAVYVYRHFGTYGRRSKTIVVLGIYPVFSFTALLGYVIPRAGTLCDLMANMYLSICMLQFMRLLVDYFGGSKRVWNQVEGTNVILRTPPCCCCIVCLPVIKFNRRVFIKLQMLVMQVALVRPLLMFIAAVLWADGAYTPGVIAANNAYIYIATVNVSSTMWAVYALIVLKNTFSEALKEFNIGGKFISLQLVLLLSVIPNLFLNILVQYGVIPCDTLFSSKARGERIYHMFMVIMMLPVALMGRFFYRRKHQGRSFAEPKSTTEGNGDDQKHAIDFDSEKHASFEDLTLNFKGSDKDDNAYGYQLSDKSTENGKVASKKHDDNGVRSNGPSTSVRGSGESPSPVDVNKNSKLISSKV